MAATADEGVRAISMLPHPDDTIVALSSAAGPGARAVVRLSGPRAFALVATRFQSVDTIEPKQRRCYRGHLTLPGVDAPLPAGLFCWPGPRSYTGQDVAEVHTVSCPPLLDVLVAELLKCGVRAALPGEFTQRAFLAG